jgi:hypothetical protein
LEDAPQPCGDGAGWRAELADLFAEAAPDGGSPGACAGAALETPPRTIVSTYRSGSPTTGREESLEDLALSATFELAEFEFPPDPEQPAKPMAPAVTMRLMHAAREIETAAPVRLRSIPTPLLSADTRNLTRVDSILLCRITCRPDSFLNRSA